MRRISFFSTPFYMFLTEVPFVVILILAIIYNPYSEGYARLYPLITMMAAAIIFSNLFLFRAVTVSRCKIRDRGLFSPRDYTELKAGSSIRLLPTNHGRVKIYVYGNAGLPELDWMRGGTEKPDEICMYRGRTQGGLRVVSDLLSYFEVPSDEIEKIISGGDFCKDYKECKVTVLKVIDEKTEYRIELKRTITDFKPSEAELSSGTVITSERLSSGEWESVISDANGQITTHRSRRVKKQLCHVLSELEATDSDIRELFAGECEINLDLVFASNIGGKLTVKIK